MQIPLAAVAAGTILLGAAYFGAAPASLTAFPRACSTLYHDVAGGHRGPTAQLQAGATTQFTLSDRPMPPGGAECSTGPARALAGSCVAMTAQTWRSSMLAPEPTQWTAYWLRAPRAIDHGDTGKLAWDGVVASRTWLTDPAGAAWTVCATIDGTPSSAPMPGSYSLVLRDCRALTGSCEGATSFDVNNDATPGNAGPLGAVRGAAWSLTAE